MHFLVRMTMLCKDYWPFDVEFQKTVRMEINGKYVIEYGIARARNRELWIADSPLS